MLKPFYRRKKFKQLEDSVLNIDQCQDTLETSSEETLSAGPDSLTSETLDNLDTHITLGSWFVESVAYIAIGLTHTFIGQMIG